MARGMNQYDAYGNIVGQDDPYATPWNVGTGAGAAPAGSALPSPGNFTTYGPGGSVLPTAPAAPQVSAAPAEAAPAAPAPSSGGGGGGGASLIDPYTAQFTPPAPVNLGGPAGIPYIPPTPQFNAPTYTPPPAFVGPDAQTVLSRPGYAFRLNQGEQTLQNQKAAQGILGTGATLKAILGYGQDYASNEYQNEWNRALGEYNTNYQTQYTDPYKFAYQGALDAFAPQMQGYQTQAAAGQHQNDQNYLNAWNQQLFNYDVFRNQQNDTFQKQYALMGL